jgi:hypothetical protein
MIAPSSAMIRQSKARGDLAVIMLAWVVDERDDGQDPRDILKPRTVQIETRVH